MASLHQGGTPRVHDLLYAVGELQGVDEILVPRQAPRRDHLVEAILELRTPHEGEPHLVARLGSGSELLYVELVAG